MKKFTTAERLNQIMSERNMKQVDILEACRPYCEEYGIKLEKNDLSQYVSGKVTPRQDKLMILGLALDVNEVWLMGYDVLPSKYAIQCTEEAAADAQCDLISQCGDAREKMKHEKTAKRLRDALREAGISQQELADKSGVGKSSISQYINGSHAPSIASGGRMSEVLGVAPEWLMGFDVPKIRDMTYGNVFPIKPKPFPILGEISCGEPRFAAEGRESYVMSGTDIKADFCLRAKGDSMINARIHDGDIVFIRRQDIVENGEIAAVIVNGDSEATLKRLYYYEEQALLVHRPENPAYEEQRYSGEQLNSIRILGKAIAFQGDVR